MDINKDEIKLYQKAIDKWGVEIQLVVLMGECAGLIKECSKILREKRLSCGGVSFLTQQDFIAECIDVMIMINQMHYGWLGDSIEWDTNKNQKLSKVAEWLSDDI